MSHNHNENQIARSEHDREFDVKRVSVFNDDGDGNLVRQGKVATEANQELMLEAIGAATSSTNSKVSVGTSTTVVLAADTARKTVTSVNDSNEDIYISIEDTAVMNEGIKLVALGGTLTLNKAEGAELAINAICASGSKNITVNTTT